MTLAHLGSDRCSIYLFRSLKAQPAVGRVFMHATTYIVLFPGYNH